MVRAIRENRKTQTRRLAKPRRRVSLLEREEDGSMMWSDSYIFDPGNAEWLADDQPCKPGDRYWTREAWRTGRLWDGDKPSAITPGSSVSYEATRLPMSGRLRPGMFMPRWASRDTLEVKGIRLERLNAISEADAIAEGLVWRDALEAWAGTDDPNWPTFTDPRRAYQGLWNHINGAGAWDLNPLVWVIEFARL